MYLRSCARGFKDFAQLFLSFEKSLKVAGSFIRHRE